MFPAHPNLPAHREIEGTENYRQVVEVAYDGVAPLNVILVNSVPLYTHKLLTDVVARVDIPVKTPVVPDIAFKVEAPVNVNVVPLICPEVGDVESVLIPFGNLVPVAPNGWLELPPTSAKPPRTIAITASAMAMFVLLNIILVSVKWLLSCTI